jgi:D-serine deaminase-like pyridoxal phosphate-dependent protein
VLRDRPITTADKGFGPLAARLLRETGQPLTAGWLAGQRPALLGGEFSFPLMTLRDSALAHNIAGMAAYCARAGVELAPHGKASMSPQLAARQLAAGAWGITVATVGQLQAYREYGVRRLLLASELTDRAGIGWLAGELAADPGLEAYCYVDSLDGVALLDAELRGCGRWQGRRLPVLVELGHDDGRTGARTVAGAVEVARAAAATQTLRVAGVAGYEGSLGEASQAAPLTAAAAYCGRLRELALALDAAGIALSGQLVTAGGSGFFDVVTRELTAGWPGQAPVIVLRSGAYLSHDHGMYARASPAERGTAPGLTLRPAFELWAGVLSRPEPGLALLSAGRRDVAFDADLPVPLRAVTRAGAAAASAGLPGAALSADGMRVTALADQHAFLQLPPASPLAPGDLVCLGISHPCTTFDKWRVIPVTDDEGRVIDAVHTFF